MKIIPVLDLMNGLVVHARRGRRADYRPLQSPLCKASEPRALIEGLLDLHPFRTLYAADLDALTGRGRQTVALEHLGRAFPELELWVDQGFPDRGERPSFPPWGRIVPVIGSESLDDQRLLSMAQLPRDFILSLDFRNGVLVGPTDLLERPDLWPERIILMSLSRVGSGDGPDFVRAERFVRRHPKHRFIAAGGVRNERDLERLEALGMAAVLVASALHSGTIDSGVLNRFG